MEKTCPFCHLTISTEDPWCGFCGKRLDSVELLTTEQAQLPATVAEQTLSLTSLAPIEPQELIERGTCIGNFKLVKLLGVGGGGAVFLGEHQKIDRRVAIKVLKPGLETNPEIASRFKQEAALLSKLRHPSIVEVYDCGLSEEVGLFLIMEYLEGCSLDQYLKKHRALSPREAALIGWQILNGLEAAHAAKVIHRDLKPQNIYMAEVGTRTVVKILDFGIAKVLDQKTDVTTTQTGVILGTPAYMSPEQASSSRELDHRSDLYSFGVVLFEMVTGQRPFQAKSATHLMVMHRIELPPRPSAFAPDLPRAMERLILDCLEKHPDDRPQNAAIPKEILQRVLTQEGSAVSLGDSPPNPFKLPKNLIVENNNEQNNSKRQAIPAGLIKTAQVAALKPPAPPAPTPPKLPGKAIIGVAVGLFALLLFVVLWFANVKSGVLLETSPAGATITTIDGTVLGNTPLELDIPSGGLEVKLSLPGFSEFRLPLDKNTPAHLMVPLSRSSLP